MLRLSKGEAGSKFSPVSSHVWRVTRPVQAVECGFDSVYIPFVLGIDIICECLTFPKIFMLKVREEYMRERWE
jgi:hypothetical protein